MEHIKTFLETSTIHGFYHVGTAKRYIKLFWIFIIAACFSTAIYMIYLSFDNWNKNPITTTIETKTMDTFHIPKERINI